MAANRKTQLPSNDDDGFEDLGSGERRSQFFRFSDVKDGQELAVEMVEDMRRPDDFEGQYSKWEALCRVDGVEVLLAVGNAGLAAWLTRNAQKEGTCLVLRARGTGLNRTWGAKVDA